MNHLFAGDRHRHPAQPKAKSTGEGDAPHRMPRTDSFYFCRWVKVGRVALRLRSIPKVPHLCAVPRLLLLGHSLCQDIWLPLKKTTNQHTPGGARHKFIVVTVGHRLMESWNGKTRRCSGALTFVTARYRRCSMSIPIRYTGPAQPVYSGGEGYPEEA